VFTGQPVNPIQIKVMTKKRDSALILVGHGSTQNPDSSAPTFQHADEIVRRQIFSEVRCCFWKEEPSFREIFYLLESREVYVVPNFISNGYFTETIIPREMELTGRRTVRNGMTIKYCEPVGNDPRMVEILLRKAEEVAPGVAPERTSLLIAGHGTSLNERSAEAAQNQVKLIRERSHFAEVSAAYMEEAPFIADWQINTHQPNVVVVPFFISDGLHSYQDIPVLLGIESEPTAAASDQEVFRRNPYKIEHRELYYASSIGTDPLMADVILDTVEQFDRESFSVPAA
jgi:sirohydrochlorin cobaltochelatase